MSDFDRAIAFVLEHEGGYSNDHADKGGPTNFGISQRAFPDVNIESLTRNDAIELYRKHFWDKIRGDELPWPLSLVVFDYAVHSGCARAVATLQDEIGMPAEECDGRMGPDTLEQVRREQTPIDSTAVLARDLLAARAKHLIHLRKPKFLRGWMNRIVDLALEVSA